MADDVFFISGTDTGCGKTLAAESLLVALKKQGLKVAGMKPVATGAELTPNGLVNDDALRLQAQTNVPADYSEINPFVFETPCSPNIAAVKAGGEIDLQSIKQACSNLRGRADKVIVEGIGGWRAPLSEHTCASDIALLLEAPVIFVVALRLGCISHTLLSIEAMEKDGAPVLGWIANQLEPDYLTAEETQFYLQSRINAPLLGVFPRVNEQTVSPGEIWKYLDVAPLL